MNKAIKILKASFNTAFKKRQLEFSPAESVDEAEPNRRPFTADELNKLMKSADGE